GPAGDLNLCCLIREVAVVVQKSALFSALAVDPTGLADGEFAIVTQGFSMRQRVVPNEPGRRISQGIDVAILHAIRVAAGKASEGTLQVIGRYTRVGPLMTVGAQDGRAISIVQQRKFPHELVLVGRDLFPENAKFRIAIPALSIAEDLVISSVFLNDINHMF